MTNSIAPLQQTERELNSREDAMEQSGGFVLFSPFQGLDLK